MIMRAGGDERGSGAIEVSIAVTSLLLVLWFVVGGLRITNTGGDVKAAARAAARAAVVEYDDGAAQASARRVAADVLSNRGVSCQSFGVSFGGGLVRGQPYSVTVSCVVSLADVARVGFPGTRTLVGTAVDFVDRIRGDGP
jgi:Flp pilus assembly protein TadG